LPRKKAAQVDTRQGGDAPEVIRFAGSVRLTLSPDARLPFKRSVAQVKQRGTSRFVASPEPPMSELVRRTLAAGAVADPSSIKTIFVV
jgi:hypothetical protein